MTWTGIRDNTKRQMNGNVIVEKGTQEDGGGWRCKSREN